MAVSRIIIKYNTILSISKKPVPPIRSDSISKVSIRFWHSDVFLHCADSFLKNLIIVCDDTPVKIFCQQFMYKNFIPTYSTYRNKGHELQYTLH